MFSRILIGLLAIFALSAQSASVGRYPVNILNFSTSQHACDPSGATDSTACIQAAIDYASAHGIQGIACPDGIYKFSQPLFLDAPGNLRGSHSAWASGTTYALGDVVNYDASGDSGTTDPIPWVSLANSNIGNAPSVSSADWAPTTDTPTNFNQSLSFASLGQGAAGDETYGCQLNPTFNNAASAFWVGTGHTMKVQGVRLFGPGGTYRSLLNTNGVGLGIAGGNAGAHVTILRDTFVENFSTCYKTNANGIDAFSDSNDWESVSADVCHIVFQMSGSNPESNIIRPTVLGDYDIGLVSRRHVTVEGGNFSSTSVNAAFTISSVSSLTNVGTGGNIPDGVYRCKTANCWEFTATISSPDTYIKNGVYNACNIVTSHFGVIPLLPISYSAGTETFALQPEWQFFNYGSVSSSLDTTTDMPAELAAATTVYCAQRIIVFQSPDVEAHGQFFEDGAVCLTLLDSVNVNATDASNAISGFEFNSDPGLTGYQPAVNSDPPSNAAFYCQQNFPFVWQEPTGSGTIHIGPGSYDQSPSNASGLGIPSAPVLITMTSQGTNDQIYFADTHYELIPNVEVENSSVPSVTASPSGNNINTAGHGGAIWATNPYITPLLWNSHAPGGVDLRGILGEMNSPFAGFRPAPWTTPNLPPEIYSLVSGALGDIGHYPLINGETLYRSNADFNSGAETHAFARSASGPGFSYGQNLTDSVIGETVTWSYKSQSNVLYLDAYTLQSMFPGLGLTVNSQGPYIVTGVYPQLGYVTLLDATAGYNSTTKLLPGTKTTVNSCASSCSIGQAAYSWTQYP